MQLLLVHGMIARAMENGIYFASVNFALRNLQAATSVIAPDTTFPWGTLAQTGPRHARRR